MDTQNKMAALISLSVTVFVMLLAIADTHIEVSDQQDSDTSDDSEHEKIHRRKLSTRNWQFEGLPIDLPDRRSADKKIAKNIKSTTKTNPLIMPPLDRRYRRIYNPDETASIEEYPFMAALLVNNQLWCGGALIGQDKVLTAAHCLQLQYNNRFFREYVKMLTVRVGTTNATSGGELLSVTEIFFHPNYKPDSLEFNFAVVKLHKNLTLGKYDGKFDKIEYSREKVIPMDQNIVFLGWGSVLGTGGVGGQVLLQKVELPIYHLIDCQEIYGRDLVTHNHFCAGYISKSKNVCNHDAGGPAVLNNKLVGILSFSSKRCDQMDKPAVFSSVGVVAQWLDNIGKKKPKLRQHN